MRNCNLGTIGEFLFGDVPLAPLAILIFCILIWCAPGLYLSAALNVSRQRAPIFVLIRGWALNAGMAYAAFWVFFLNRNAGVAVSWTLCAATMAMLASLPFLPRIRSELRAPDVWIPTALMLATALFYLATLVVCKGPDPRVNAAAHRYLPGDLPSDNIIPRIFAERLYRGEDPRIIFGNGSDAGTWHSSDRPPLQTGIELLQMPVSEFFNWDSKIQYQIAGLLAQCIWIPALWALLRALKCSARTLAIVFAASIFSGFFMLNSVFVWPKLLAAGLAMMAFVIVLADSRRTAGSEISDVCLAASLAALAMLAHAGVAFFYPAMAVVAYRRRFALSFKPAALGILVFALWLLPWSAYQKYFDPPGNRLMKWHLAGDLEIDELTVPQALERGYSSLTLEAFESNKLANIGALVGPAANVGGWFWPSREEQFLHLFKTLGYLNLGWLLLFGGHEGLKKLRAANTAHEFGHARMLLEMALATALLWIFVLFLPGSTVVHAGSYAVMMALFAGLAILIAQMNTAEAIALLTVHIVHFFAVWVFGSIPRGSEFRPSAMAAVNGLAIGIIAALVLIGRNYFFSDDSPSPLAPASPPL